MYILNGTLKALHNICQVHTHTHTHSLTGGCICPFSQQGAIQASVSCPRTLWHALCHQPFDHWMTCSTSWTAASKIVPVIPGPIYSKSLWWDYCFVDTIWHYLPRDTNIHIWMEDWIRNIQSMWLLQVHFLTLEHPKTETWLQRIYSIYSWVFNLMVKNTWKS